MDQDEFSNFFLNESNDIGLSQLINGFLSFKSGSTKKITIQNLKLPILEDKCNLFLNKVDYMFDHCSTDQINQFFSDFLDFFKNSKYINKRIEELDCVIDKLISILIDIDVIDQTRLCIIIISCLEKIIKIYNFFIENESIESLNSFIIDLFNNCPNQEMLYCLLSFLDNYYGNFYEQTSEMINQVILPAIIDDDFMLFHFLPTKENQMFINNPVIFLYMIFIYHEVTNDADFAPQVQTIFDYLSKYMSECLQLRVSIEDSFKEMEETGNYDNNEFFELDNKKVENHISESMKVYLIAFSQIGGDFFDLYNHEQFPQNFISFLSYDGVKDASIDFINICLQKEIDLERFLDDNFFISLVKLLRNGNSNVRIKAIEIIEKLILENNNLINNFIAANIENSNIFKKGINDTDSYIIMLKSMKLVQTIIHFYPSGEPYNFDIREFVLYCISLLEKGSSDITAIIFQFLIDIYYHLLILGGTQLSLFESLFRASGGIEISFEYKEDSFDTEAREYAIQLLSLFEEEEDKE